METAIIPVTMPVMPIAPADYNEPLSSEVPPNKCRRKKSIVWDHFTVETVGEGCIRACCNQCKKSFAYISGSKLAGTSHLKRHIALGICPVSRQRKNQQTPDSKTGNATNQPKKRYPATPGFANIPFNQERCNHEIAKMIIMHEYPLHIVEHRGFIDFVKTLQPQFNTVTFNTIKADSVTMFLKEKQCLLNFISEIPGRVSLSIDLWISNQTVGYVLLTGQFIDAEWNLHRLLLNVVTIPFLDSDSALQQAVVSCLSDWHLENRLFTLTLDQSSNEIINGSLRALFSVRNPYMLHGQLLVGNCFAHVISLLAQEALWAVGETVKKIRDSVKFVKTSDTHEETFFHLREQLKVPSMKDIFIDDQTKWNTTYEMLVVASELKQVFLCLETSIPDYKIAPSMDDWKQVEILCKYLKLFFDAVSILMAPTYPTASSFYHEVSKVQLELTHAAMSNDPFISNLTKPLKEKFDRYWSNCFLVLAIAVIMDPRFKMKLVEFSFSRIYGEDAGIWIKIVDDDIHELYLEYIAQEFPPPETFVEERNESIISVENGGIIPKAEPFEEGYLQGAAPEGYLQEGPPQEVAHQEIPHQEVALEEIPSQDPLISIGDGLSDFEVYISEIDDGSQQMKSELDQYLEESLLPRIQDFAILSWWKLNKTKYPTLSRMASDILSIPFSTVDRDSVFDTESKKMDSYRSSLRPETLEALICTKDWVQYGASSRSSNPMHL